MDELKSYHLEALGEPVRPSGDPGFTATPVHGFGEPKTSSYSPRLPSAPAGCPILKNWEKKESDVLPVLGALKLSWETSVDVRKEDQLSKSGLEHRGAGVEGWE